MPKKTARKRRSSRSSRNSANFSKFLTFPILAVFAFMFLAVFTVYQVSKPSSDIKGVSSAEYIDVTREEGIRIAASSGGVTRLVHVKVFRDPNANARQSLTENCYDNEFQFRILSYSKTDDLSNLTPVTKRRKFDANCSPAEGYKAHVVTHKNCNRVTLIPPEGYKVTGYTYSDGKNTNKTVVGSRRVDMCGAFGPQEGLNVPPVYQSVDFGITRN